MYMLQLDILTRNCINIFIKMNIDTHEYRHTRFMQTNNANHITQLHKIN